eukprot:TRINITY_DN65120_c0_g1_i1.p1 TRINITY_DN65120_c0_g1~~TRINITY_DN65120_c0_g1_i1.p1  ORF type:complete len:577 (+),score=60.22 TRINITY_DN65120_c0_g1_i1:146-1876(+)
MKVLALVFVFSALGERGEDECSWSVFYDLFIPSFEDHPAYSLGHRHATRHCLTWCCHDPTCTGLAVQSQNLNDCRKYSALPDAVKDQGGLPLEDGQWLLEMNNAWSILVKNPAPVVAFSAQSRHPSKYHLPNSACEWRVLYDKWIPSFDKDVYNHDFVANAYGGAHCLQACCNDPSCKGLALESSELYQCYKYGTLPSGIDVNSGLPLNDGQWLLRMKVAWSIFVKVPASVVATRPVQSQVLALPVAPSQAKKCDWTVFYDRWLPSFEQGVYKNDDVDHATGRIPCLEACCEDPTCKGLALESNELHQCYKYNDVPRDLEGEHGKPLGDARWLLRMRNSWSIFVKLPAPSLALPPASHAHDSVASTTHSDCEWMVFYDHWMPTFANSNQEYTFDSSASAYGGAHCLQACCGDPTCRGLALQSSELSQCYKYALYPHVPSSVSGQLLGDGQWLLSKKPAWSIFVKRADYLKVASRRKRRFQNKTEFEDFRKTWRKPKAPFFWLYRLTMEQLDKEWTFYTMASASTLMFFFFFGITLLLTMGEMRSPKRMEANEATELMNQRSSRARSYTRSSPSSSS